MQSQISKDESERYSILHSKIPKSQSKLLNNLSSLISLNKKLVKHKLVNMPYENLFCQMPQSSLFDDYQKVKSFKRSISDVNILKINRKIFEKEMKYYSNLSSIESSKNTTDLRFFKSISNKIYSKSK